MSRLSAWERRPGGEAGGLVSLVPTWNRDRPLPDLSDCLVARPRPWLLAVWEPLLTKAPSPAIVSAYCCYLHTVIFYARPYQVRPWKRRWWCNGRLEACRGGFEEYDKIETRLVWDDLVAFEGETFKIGGGRVVWAPHGREHRRWWMYHGARRVDADARRAA